MTARFEFPNPPHTRPCRLERVHTPTAHLFRKCSNGAFCTSKQHISPRRNDRVRPHTQGGRPHRSGARPTARPQQQQQHQHPQHQQQTATQQQHHKQQHHKQQRSKQQRSSSITNSPDPSIIISDAAEPTAAGSRGANCVVTDAPGYCTALPWGASAEEGGDRSTQQGAPATRRRLSVTRRPFRGTRP